MAIEEDKKVVSIQDVCDFIPIDEPDEAIERNINRLIGTADLYLKGAISENYPINDSRAQQSALLIIKELYLNNSTTDSMTNNVKKLVDDFCLQLKQELRRKKWLETNS